MQKYATPQYSPPMMATSSNDNNNNNNMHLLAHIPISLRQRLTLIGIFYIIVGLLSIGLDIGGLVHGADFSFYSGFVTGFFSIFCGILILVLCREQVYVLTSIFAVVLWQLLILVASFIAHIIGFYVFLSNSYYYKDRQSEIIIGIFSILTVVVSLIITIYTMVLTVGGKRPPIQPIQLSTLALTNPSPQIAHY